MHAGSMHLQTLNPLSKAPIQLCALSQVATVTRLDTDRKLGAMRLRTPEGDLGDAAIDYNDHLK